MTNEQAAEETQAKPYTSPSLKEEGSVTERTLGTNPIAPKESADLMGYDLGDL